MTRDEKQNKLMTQTNIPKLVIRLSIPTTISMLVTAIYNMADTYFVSQLGTSASGAVGIVFSLMSLIQAVGFTLGMGAGSLISRKLGEKDKKSADAYSASAFYAALVIGAVITLFGNVFIENLMKILGATDTILPYAIDYGKYIIWGAPIMCASFVLNNTLRSEGKSALSMIGLSLGGILNIVLDPILIFTFDMGTAGAAVATFISQSVSFLVLLSMFIFKKSITSLSVKNISLKPRIYLDILEMGLPSFCRQALASGASVLLNRSAAIYGDPAVAAMSIVGKVAMFVLSATLGIGQGFTPVAGYNYGAKKFPRIREAFRFTLITSTIAMTVLGVLVFIFSKDIMMLFRESDPEVISIGVLAMRCQCIAMPLQTFVVLTNMIHQGLGKAKEATFLSVCRQGIFFIPLILILPKFLGLTGVQISQGIADFLTFFSSIPFAIVFFRKLKKEEDEYNEHKC